MSANERRVLVFEKAARSCRKSTSVSFHGLPSLLPICMFVLFDLRYGVATISRLLKIINLFCKRALYKKLYSAKETYDLKEPTNRSHPIPWVSTSGAAVGAQRWGRRHGALRGPTKHRARMSFDRVLAKIGPKNDQIDPQIPLSKKEL